MDPVDEAKEREYQRRPRNTQVTIFLILGVLLAGVIYWLSQSLVGVPPAYDEGPVPILQERWQLLVPVDTTGVTSAGEPESGTSVYHLSYAAGSATELKRASTGPGVGAPVNAPLTNCSELELYLESVDTEVDCSKDLLGQQTTHARHDGDALWVVWGDKSIHVVQFIN